VYDISNNPSYVALMDIPYYSPYRAEVVNLIALLVIGLSLIFFAVIFYYYRYFFAGHITNLSQMLDEAARCGTSSNTISRTGPLEISRLSESAERVTSSLIKNRDDLNRSREERDETEERWQVLFEEAIDAMCVGDDEGIINANISWVRLFGCLRAEVVSVPLNILSLPMLSDGSDPMTLLIEKYNQVPDDGSNRFDWRVSHDGQELVFDVTIKRIRYKGDFLRFIVARDITLQRSMQDEQARAIARIDQTMVQLATLNDEIRNPLTIISGLVDIHEFNQADAILGQIKKIDAIIDRLDKGYLDSEKVRNYLKKYFEIGNR
jgi:PAS domain S-box-containing protein